MMNLVTLSGPFGPILVLIALVVLFLALRATVHLLRAPDSGAAALRERLNGLLFWGSVAAVLGFLAQCHSVYLSLNEIISAPEISPRVVAEGFVISFVPSLFGLGILVCSVAAWACLKLLAAGRAPHHAVAAPILFLLTLLLPSSLFLTGCSAQPNQAGPATLTQGVWALEAGRDEFLWEFSGSGDRLTCMVHVLAGPVKLNETPCRTAEMDGTGVRVSMDTGVRLEGEVRLDRGRIVGHLKYPDGSETEAELPWFPRSRYSALLARGSADGPYAYRVPEASGDGWTVGSASEAGVDTGALEGMVAAVERGEAGVLHSLLVARGGRLILDEYFHGYGPSDPHHLASCTKSVSSLLVGLALQEGAIPGVDARVADFFPGSEEGRGAGWDDLTLEHLLTMSMALDWNPEEAQNLHGTGPEFFRRILARSVSGTPGRDWAYVSANANLIAGVLHHATGEHAEAFAARTLFEPLGFGAWNWEGGKTDGHNLMDGSLRLLPRDMAKIGQLVLDGGRWQDRRIVDEEWIRASTARHLPAGEEDQGYGYLWWLMEAPGADGNPIPIVVANGWGSRFISVFPTLDLVVVTTGGNEYNGKHIALADALARILLPGVRTEP